MMSTTNVWGRSLFTRSKTDAVLQNLRALTSDECVHNALTLMETETDEYKITFRTFLQDLERVLQVNSEREKKETFIQSLVKLLQLHIPVPRQKNRYEILRSQTSEECRNNAVEWIHAESDQQRNTFIRFLLSLVDNLTQKPQTSGAVNVLQKLIIFLQSLVRSLQQKTPDVSSSGSSGVSSSVHKQNTSHQDNTESAGKKMRTSNLEVPAPKPPPTPMYEEPWRPIKWGTGDKDALLKVINRYKPMHGEKHLRVLVYGPVGAGKSSFINSVASALGEDRCIAAATNTSDSASSKSFTIQYKTHYIYKDEFNSDETYPFVFNDIMGMEEGKGQGILPEDIKLVIMGHVKDGYMFNQLCPINKDNHYYNANPTIDDKVHILLLTLSANILEINPSVIEKMKEVREVARNLGIPQMAIVTHIDKACPEIAKDIQNIYRSKYLKTKMEEFSKAVGIPLNCIMGVKNYSEETDHVDNIDTLLLTALKHIVNCTGLCP